MSFDEYYNIKEFPKLFLEQVKKLNYKFKKKFPDWSQEIEVQTDNWPGGNTVTLHYGKLHLTEVSEIDRALHKLFQKYDMKFEVLSGGFSHNED